MATTELVAREVDRRGWSLDGVARAAARLTDKDREIFADIPVVACDLDRDQQIQLALHYIAERWACRAAEQAVAQFRAISQGYPWVVRQCYVGCGGVEGRYHLVTPDGQLIVCAFGGGRILHEDGPQISEHDVREIVQQWLDELKAQSLDPAKHNIPLGATAQGRGCGSVRDGLPQATWAAWRWSRRRD